MNKLIFGLGGNAKLDKNIATFSLLSGWSCPGAKECYTKVVEQNEKRKIIDGQYQTFRCFSASQEVLYKNVYNSRKSNYDTILNIVKQNITKEEKVKQIFDLFVKWLPDLNKWSILRLHVGGDIFCQEYFDALIALSKAYPDKIFYAYTKSIHFWVKRLKDIPDNFKLTASYGGKYDDLIDKFNLKSVKVVMSEEEAEMYNLEIDHDDSHAYEKNDSFALLIHGSQPKNTKASIAKSNLAKKGWTGYTNKKNNKKVNDMINLNQYGELRLYLITIGLDLKLIKNLKSNFDKNDKRYIEFTNKNIIHTDVEILDEITFNYNNTVYNCFKVYQQSGNNIKLWFCNCDENYTDISVYKDKKINFTNNKVVVQPEILTQEDIGILNNYEITFVNQEVLTFKKLHNDNNIEYVFNDEGTDLLIAISNNKVTVFLNACDSLNLSFKPIINTLVNNYSDKEIVKFTKNSITSNENKISFQKALDKLNNTVQSIINNKNDLLNTYIDNNYINNNTDLTDYIEIDNMMEENTQYIKNFALKYHVSVGQNKISDNNVLIFDKTKISTDDIETKKDIIFNYLLDVKQPLSKLVNIIIKGNFYEYDKLEFDKRLIVTKYTYPKKNDIIPNNSFREDKSNKIRPDLISPYFLEALGRLMKDNNKKYPEFNYIGLSESSFFQSMWRHLIAYSEQRLLGVSDEFNNDEDHLAAIAFNLMGLIHNRESQKLK